MDHALPLLDGSSLDRSEKHDTGVVDNRVEAAELGDGSFDGRLGLVLVGDIGLEGEGAAALVFDLTDQLVEAVLPASGDGHGGAQLGQGTRRRFTDTAACTSHEGDRAVEALLAHADGLPARQRSTPGLLLFPLLVLVQVADRRLGPVDGATDDALGIGVDLGARRRCRRGGRARRLPAAPARPEGEDQGDNAGRCCCLSHVQGVGLRPQKPEPGGPCGGMAAWLSTP